MSVDFFEHSSSLKSADNQDFGGGSGRGVDHQAMFNLHTMMAHLQLAYARGAPKLSLPHASELSSTV
jgi:hypothetical protein